MTLPTHLFISDDGGALHDTRATGWASHPLRVNYRRTHRRIDSPHDLKATLRAGSFAWPGGYPMYFLMGDGEAMSFAAVRDNLRECLAAFSSRRNDPWRVIGTEINYEDPDLYCAHSGERIESAYAEDEREGA